MSNFKGSITKIIIEPSVEKSLETKDYINHDLFAENKQKSNFKGTTTKTISQPSGEKSLETQEYINDNLVSETEQKFHQGINPDSNTVLEEKDRSPKTLNILVLGAALLLAGTIVAKSFTSYLQNNVNKKSLVKKKIANF